MPMTLPEFIQIKSKKYVQAIQCLADKMITIALEDKVEDDLKTGSEEHRENSLSIYKAEKTYTPNREAEIFTLSFFARHAFFILITISKNEFIVV